jgi:effector-binding domain-containing protein
MGYQVQVLEVSAHPAAVAKGPLILGKIPEVMLGLIGQVWDFIKRTGVKSDGINVAVYYKDRIEAGARVLTPFEGDGRVYCSSTPAGLAATVAHIGPYNRMGEAHSAIVKYCAATGRKLTGVNWEVYGHWTDDESKLRTDVYYLLET